MNRRDAIAALVALPAVTRLSAARLKTDDVIVVETEAHLSHEELARITAQLTRVWPDRKIVVLDGGLTLKVVAGSQ